jgi:hypothetical protein
MGSKPDNKGISANTGYLPNHRNQRRGNKLSYLLLGIAVAAAFTALIHLIIAIRACAVGRGFDGFGSQFYYTGVISVGIVLTVWLGPLALAGIGLL